MISDIWIPIMKNNSEFFELVKEELVSKLIHFAEWKLKYRKDKPDAQSFATIRAFLSYCKDLGSTCDSYTRMISGEVV
jgi:hypothetical protein